MLTKLDVVLCRTHDEKPLAVVSGLPGECAELTPAQARTLSDRLLHIAADAENRPMHGRAYSMTRREYPLARRVMPVALKIV